MATKKRAVTYIVQVVLLAIVVTALTVLLYSYFQTWIGEKTGAAKGPEGMLVIEAGYFDGVDSFVLYVRNDGGAPVLIERAYITAPNGTVGVVDTTGGLTVVNNPLEPGQYTTVKINATAAGITNIGQDEVYTIKLVAGDGSEATISIRT